MLEVDSRSQEETINLGALDIDNFLDETVAGLGDPWA